MLLLFHLLLPTVYTRLYKHILRVEILRRTKLEFKQVYLCHKVTIIHIISRLNYNLIYVDKIFINKDCIEIVRKSHCLRKVL